MTTIDIRVLDERIREHLPAYATAGAAGVDPRVSNFHVYNFPRLQNYALRNCSPGLTGNHNIQTGEQLA